MLLVSAAAASAQTLAAPEVYGNLGYTGVFGDLDGDDLTLGGVTGRLGVKFNQYVGVEGEYTFGLQDDTIPVFGADVNVELDQQYAGYLVGSVPLSPQADIFARIGYGKVEIEAEIGGFTAGEDSNTISYGAGAQYFFDGVNGVRGDYTVYDFEDEGGEVDSLSVSYVRKF